MPSPFEAFKRIVQGRPVYDPNDNPQDPNAAAPVGPAEPQSTIQKNNASTFPVVEVRHTYSRPSGQVLQIYCSIHNAWNEQVEVDRIRLFGQESKLRFTLGPGQEREVRVYNGPLLTAQRGSEATIDYKTEAGDYFEAIHEVHYTYTSEKTYEVSALTLHLPIRDIYG